jgi:hypothetical protein
MLGSLARSQAGTAAGVFAVTKAPHCKRHLVGSEIGVHGVNYQNQMRVQARIDSAPCATSRRLLTRVADSNRFFQPEAKAHS